LEYIIHFIMQLKTLPIFVLLAVSALVVADGEEPVLVAMAPLIAAAPLSTPAPPVKHYHRDWSLGGSEDDICHVPYTVSILWQNFHFAVGTIVDCQTIVTSAHAVK
jgi:hypothetical protein